MAVVLFDGVCNFCNGSVQFVMPRDPAGYFQFAALGTEPATRVLRAAHVDGPLPDSMVLVEDGQVFTRSDAALRIARRLTFPWPLFWGLVVVPRALRDAVYDVIARHRYRWFGKRESCLIPKPGYADRFLR
jgi:predicted DCC family thiol-disulfide oxidoreductase YuxK